MAVRPGPARARRSCPIPTAVAGRAAGRGPQGGAGRPAGPAGAGTRRPPRPHHGDEVGHPAGGLPHLRQQRRHAERGRDPTQPGLQQVVAEQRGRPLAPVHAHPGGGQRGRDHAVPTGAALGQPVGQRVLPVGDRQRPLVRRLRPDLPAQRVQRGQLTAGERTEAPERPEQRGTGVLQRTGRAGRRRGRVVDLVREAGRQRAEGDQRLPLPGDRLDPADRTDEAQDDVHAEGEPGRGQLPQRVRRHPQHAAGGRGPAGGEVDAGGVPGPEPTGPLPGRVHPGQHRLLVPDPADQADRTLQQHPPVLGRPRLDEQLVPGLERHPLAGGLELSQLTVVQAVEQRDGAQLVSPHPATVRPTRPGRGGFHRRPPARLGPWGIAISPDAREAPACDHRRRERWSRAAMTGVARRACVHRIEESPCDHVPSCPCSPPWCRSWRSWPPRRTPLR